jgi:hypothetical protein
MERIAMTDLTPILKALVTLCAVLITAYVIPWLKARGGVAGLESLLAWVDVAVKAAEQLYTSADGAEKKRYVLNFLQGKGYSIDTDEVDNAIEAAVLSLHAELYGTEGTTE